MSAAINYIKTFLPFQADIRTEKMNMHNYSKNIVKSFESNYYWTIASMLEQRIATLQKTKFDTTRTKQFLESGQKP